MRGAVSASLWRNHSFVVGRTGVGKSHLVRLLVQQLKGSGIVLLFTPSSEYREVAPKLRTPCRYWDADNMVMRFAVSDLAHALGLNATETSAVRSILFGQEARGAQRTLWDKPTRRVAGGPPVEMTAEEAASVLEESDSEVARSVAHRLRHTGLKFSRANATGFDIDSGAESGLHVVDMSGYDDRSAQFVMAKTLGRVFDTRKSGRSRSDVPLLVIVEEAHNFVPSTHGALSKDICARIAREGRKLGMSLMIVSQRPRQVDPTVTSQARNFFLFQLRNPDDVEHVIAQTPMLDGDSKDVLRTLRERECLVSLENSRHLTFTVRAWDGS